MHGNKTYSCFTKPFYFQCKSVSSRTGNEDAKALMCSEAPTEKYWELLAEERRKALFAALEENKQVYMLIVSGIGLRWMVNFFIRKCRRLSCRASLGYWYVAGRV